MPTGKCISHLSPKILLYADRDHYKKPYQDLNNDHTNWHGNLGEKILMGLHS